MLSVKTFAHALVGASPTRVRHPTVTRAARTKITMHLVGHCYLNGVDDNTLDDEDATPSEVCPSVACGATHLPEDCDLVLQCNRCGKEGHWQKFCPAFCGRCRKDGHVPSRCEAKMTRSKVPLGPNPALRSWKQFNWTRTPKPAIGVRVRAEADAIRADLGRLPIEVIDAVRRATAAANISTPAYAAISSSAVANTPRPAMMPVTVDSVPAWVKCWVCDESGRHLGGQCPQRKCMNCGQRGHSVGAPDCRLQCQRCHQRGHESDRCPQVGTLEQSYLFSGFS